MPLTAVIVDDEKVAVENLARSLEMVGDIDVVAVSSKPHDAIKLVVDIKPELLFLDVEMPGMSGLDVIRKIHEHNCFPATIFVTGYNQYAIKAIKNMAFDYLLKPIDIDELQNAIKRFVWVTHKSEQSKLEQNKVYLSDLSERELDILHLILQGLTSQLISEKLFISKTTVDTHRQNILKKTGCKTTFELVSRLSG